MLDNSNIGYFIYSSKRHMGFTPEEIVEISINEVWKSTVKEAVMACKLHESLDNPLKTAISLPDTRVSKSVVLGRKYKIKRELIYDFPILDDPNIYKLFINMEI